MKKLTQDERKTLARALCIYMEAHPELHPASPPHDPGDPSEHEESVFAIAAKLGCLGHLDAEEAQFGARIAAQRAAERRKPKAKLKSGRLESVAA